MKVAPGGRAGTLMLVASAVLAAGAICVLLLTSDDRALRLGLLAALWAAMLAGVLAARYRTHAVQAEEVAEQAQDSVERAQEVYEQELEREVTARKQHELEFELAKRKELEDASRAELDRLRSEVEALQQTLRQLLDGEVLYERIALTAQATRMRAGGDDVRYLEQGGMDAYDELGLEALANSMDGARHGAAYRDNAGTDSDHDGARQRSPAPARAGHANGVRPGQPQEASTETFARVIEYSDASHGGSANSSAGGFQSAPYNGHSSSYNGHAARGGSGTPAAHNNGHSANEPHNPAPPRGSHHARPEDSPATGGPSGEASSWFTPPTGPGPTHGTGRPQGQSPGRPQGQSSGRPQGQSSGRPDGQPDAGPAAGPTGRHTAGHGSHVAEHEPRTWQQWGADDSDPPRHGHGGAHGAHSAVRAGQHDRPEHEHRSGHERPAEHGLHSRHDRVAGDATHDRLVGEDRTGGQWPAADDRRARGAHEADEPDDTGTHAEGRPVSELLASYGGGVEPRRRRRRE
ncbi:hypothetical protein SAMN06265360_11270 [Haloechinothrix alba]|uniref:DUF6779 domain-containing protein n=1 Tax=Haloechinothrix alba TaxID=664784 RepID=A0A238XSZ9_9PSEU|nr:DUF6779 domain-containing protein [Haloechinothrix alba]SNR62047.1 hypothetical protein SAMN06265360_11270 [Haloechinothrix alba]